jgi:thiosulfate dehydrogenase (quinone) large subunit
MTTITHDRPLRVTPRRSTESARPLTGIAAYALAVLRIAFGLTFLWAFFDKLLALGYSTGQITNSAGDRTGIDFMAKGRAWLNGGSPTKGFLSHVSDHNPLRGMWNSMAGTAWADWLFMIGLAGIGIALTFGIGMRIAGVAGALLYLFLWVASWPLTTNPVIDDHVLGAISVAVLALTYAGDTWGFGRRWARTPLVTRYPVLR